MNRKALVLAGAITLLIVLLAVGVWTRKEATLKVRRAASGEVKRLPDGSLVNFYTAYLENRSDRPGTFSLQATPVPGYRVDLVGPVRELKVPANGNRRVDLALKIAPTPPGRMELELKLLRDGETVALTALPLLVE